MGFPLGSYCVSVVFLWGFFGMYMIFLLDFYDISMNYCGIKSLWYFYGLLWELYGVSMKFLGISMVVL